jgi:hypothetical protein
LKLSLPSIEALYLFVAMHMKGCACSLSPLSNLSLSPLAIALS